MVDKFKAKSGPFYAVHPHFQPVLRYARTSNEMVLDSPEPCSCGKTGLFVLSGPAPCLLSEFSNTTNDVAARRPQLQQSRLFDRRQPYDYPTRYLTSCN